MPELGGTRPMTEIFLVAARIPVDGSPTHFETFSYDDTFQGVFASQVGDVHS